MMLSVGLDSAEEVRVVKLAVSIELVLYNPIEPEHRLCQGEHIPTPKIAWKTQTCLSTELQRLSSPVLVRLGVC